VFGHTYTYTFALIHSRIYTYSIGLLHTWRMEYVHTHMYAQMLTLGVFAREHDLSEAKRTFLQAKNR